ncbi:MAG: mechanosensitive ion channel family protein [Fervidobacterium sp.]|uniref:mechanosensitive ion channel family protein n=1 Tax=Fervidobacterium sp. TaxID=1871331 RepID=UPI0040490924
MDAVILKNVFLSILTVVIAYVVHRIVMRSIDKFVSTLGKEVKAPKTLSLILAFLIYGFAIAGILAIWDVNLTPYLAGLGISGIVIGLALQEPLTNFMSGILVLVTRKVFEGEVVDVDGLTGIVDIVKMNHVHLKTFDGKMILIPNRKVWSGTVTKFWPGPYRRIDVDVTVDYSSDLHKVVEILKKVLEDEPLVVKDSSVENNVIFKSFDSSGIIYTVRFWTERATYFDTLNAVAHRIKAEFERSGIKIPFSIVEVKLVK